MSEDLLKLIAVLSMLVDHVGYCFFPANHAMTIIGRIAFPVYAFMIVEGFCHTQDVRKYAARLLAFGIISEVPFDLAFYSSYWDPGHQNVFWTLLLGLLSLVFIRMIKVEQRLLRTILQVAVAVPFALTGQLIHSDYRWIGVGLIAGFYIFRDLGNYRLFLTPVFLNGIFSGTLENYAFLGIIPLWFYNGERHYRSKGVRMAFYILYPAHLLALWIVREVINARSIGGVI